MFAGMLQATETARPNDNAAWPKLSWIMVFQFPITEIISVIVLEATEASNSYCSTSLSPHFGHFWSLVIHTIGLILCVISIFRFYGRMKQSFKARRAGWKLWGFKGIVFSTEAIFMCWLWSR